MNSFSIKIISRKLHIFYGIPSAIGRITIGDFSERFVMPLDCWTREDYKTQ